MAFFLNFLPSLIALVVFPVLLWQVIRLSFRVKKLEQKLENNFEKRSRESVSAAGSGRERTEEAPAWSGSRVERAPVAGAPARPDSSEEPTVRSASGPDSTETFQGQPERRPEEAPASRPEPDSADRLVAWLKEDWLLKLGVLLLLIGFSSFITYAFINNWIGPVGRVTFGLLLGAGVTAFGWWRMREYRHQGGIFLVLGSTILIITIFTGFMVYQFFSPVSIALALVFLSAAFVGAASVYYRSYPLALASLLLASLAPILVFISAEMAGTVTRSVLPLETGILAYLLVVALGSVWVSAVTGWRSINTAALVVIFAYSLPLWFYEGSQEPTLLLLAFALGALFFVVNTVGIVKKQASSIVPPLLTAAGNGLFLVIWILDVIPRTWQSLMIAAWMLVFTVGAFLTLQIVNRREPFFVYGAVGVALLTLATGVELQHNLAALFAAYTLESALIPGVVYMVTRQYQVAEKLTLIFIGPVALSVPHLISLTRQVSVFNQHSAVLLLLTAVLAVTGAVLYRGGRLRGREISKLGVTWLVASSIYFYLLIWIFLHILLEHAYLATMLSLVIYTLDGLAAYLWGQFKESRILKIYGGVLLLVVVARLLTVEVWTMDITGKIITFGLIGLLLMSTAFLRRKSSQDEEK